MIAMPRISASVSVLKFHLSACAFVIVSWICGCNRTEDYPRVVYKDDLPRKAPTYVVDMGRLKLTDIDKAGPAKFLLPKRVSIADGISYKGSIETTDSAMRPHGVLILIRRRDDEKKIVVNSMASAAEKKGALVTFDVQMNSPLTVGAYVVDVLAMANDHPMLCISRGELNVE